MVTGAHQGMQQPGWAGPGSSTEERGSKLDMVLQCTVVGSSCKCTGLQVSIRERISLPMAGAAPYTTPTSQLKEFTTKVGKKLLGPGLSSAGPSLSEATVEESGLPWTS